MFSYIIIFNSNNNKLTIILYFTVSFFFLLQIGEIIDKNCDERCTCNEGAAWICAPRCTKQYFKRGKKIDDPLCREIPSPDDECCAYMICDDHKSKIEGNYESPCAYMPTVYNVHCTSTDRKKIFFQFFILLGGWY